MAPYVICIVPYASSIVPYHWNIVIYYPLKLSQCTMTNAIGCNNSFFPIYVYLGMSESVVLNLMREHRTWWSFLQPIDTYEWDNALYLDIRRMCTYPIWEQDYISPPIYETYHSLRYLTYTYDHEASLLIRSNDPYPLIRNNDTFPPICINDPSPLIHTYHMSLYVSLYRKKTAHLSIWMQPMIQVHSRIHTH